MKDHHIIPKSMIISINKLRPNKLYSTLVSNVENTHTSQLYFEKNLSIETYKIEQNISTTTENYM